MKSQIKAVRCNVCNNIVGCVIPSMVIGDKPRHLPRDCDSCDKNGCDCDLFGVDGFETSDLQHQCETCVGTDYMFSQTFLQQYPIYELS